VFRAPFEVGARRNRVPGSVPGSVRDLWKTCGLLWISRSAMKSLGFIVSQKTCLGAAALIPWLLVTARP